MAQALSSEMRSQQIDRTRLDGLARPTAKAVKSEFKVLRFVNGTAFQEFCDNPVNKIRSKMLIHISCCEDNIYYALSSGAVIDDFRVSLSCREGLRLFKRSKFISKPDHPSEIRCFYAATYWVTQKDGYWRAELVLGDGGELSKKAVKEALSKVATLKGYTLDGNLQMSSVAFCIPSAGTQETKAWTQKAVTGKGEERILLCLVDNGRIIDVTESQMLESAPCPDNILRTKFSWFRYEPWQGVYERLND